MKAKNIIKLFFLLSIFGCNKEKAKEYSSFIPYVCKEKYESFLIDIDGDLYDDILIYVDSTMLNSNVKNGVYSNSVDGSILFTYGVRKGSISFELLNQGDVLREELDWMSFLTLDGYIISNGFIGELEYLGFKKYKWNKWNYGWLKIETTDSSFCIKEIYYNENKKEVKVGEF